MSGARAVFLDKDGTLVENVPYNVDPGQVRLTHGAAEGLALLHAAGYRLYVVSNQSGVARGYFPEGALAGVEARLRGLLAEAGVPLAGFACCPHHPEGTVAEYAVECDCRKPAPGLLLRLAEADGVELALSWMVGDAPGDVEAGRRAGCRTVLVESGEEAERRLAADALPHHAVGSVAEAARVILAADGVEAGSTAEAGKGR